MNTKVHCLHWAYQSNTHITSVDLIEVFQVKKRVMLDI